MASYETIPKEAEPLVAAAPKAASPKFKVTAAALCIACAVAGYQAPAAVRKYLSFGATGGEKLPSSELNGSWDVQICLKGTNYCLGPVLKSTTEGNKIQDPPLGGDDDLNRVTLFTKSDSPSQGIQKFRLEKYSSTGQADRYYLRFLSRDGNYDGCVALYGRNGQYSNGGSPIQMQECQWIDNSGGQRQQITLPMGGGNPRQGQKYDGYLDYVLTQKFCIGSTDGSPSNNKDVFSNKCYNTKYTVEYLSNQY